MGREDDNQRWLGNDLEGDDRGMFQGTNPASALKY
jgi:hypothetical protein